MIKINLGCGRKRFHKQGYINIDVSPGCEPDVLLDVEHDPLPYADNTATEIVADNLFEHFEDLVFVLNECHRVLMMGGRLWFRVPAADRFEYATEHAPHGVDKRNEAIKIVMWGAFRDPTHKKFFCEGTFDYWNAEHPTFKNYGGPSYNFKPWTVDLKVTHNPSNGLFFYDAMQFPVKV